MARSSLRLCAVLLWLGLVPVLAPAAGAHAAGLGITEDLQYLSPAAMDARLEQYAALGVRRVRFQLQWATVERTRGQYDWAATDGVIDRLAAHGIAADVLLQTTPAWARAPDCRDLLCPPADPAEFARFAGVAATRYAGRVEAYEVWNEPNNPAFWKPRPDPGVYAALLRAAYPALKTADRNAVVLSGGLAPTGTVPAAGGGYEWVNQVDFVQALYDDGAGASFDAVAVHPYTFPSPPLLAAAGSAWSQLEGTTPSVRSVMVAHGDGAKPLWATEFGAPTGPAGNTRAVTEIAQAMTIDEGYRAWEQQPWAGPMIVWTYADFSDGRDENAHFGLVRADGTPKVAWATVRGINAAACVAGPARPRITRSTRRGRLVRIRLAVPRCLRGATVRVRVVRGSRTLARRDVVARTGRPSVRLRVPRQPGRRLRVTATWQGPEPVRLVRRVRALR